jgi:hypothetical protein
MGTFQAKEGLYEYSIKRLGADEREEALRRIQRNVRLTDDSLKEFMNIGTRADEHEDAAPSAHLPNF